VTRTVHRGPEPLQLALGLLAVRDFAGDAAIARKPAGGVEHRFAARLDILQPAVVKNALVLEFAEWLVRIQERLVFRPAAGDWNDAAKVPAMQPDRLVLVRAPALDAAAAGKVDEAMVCVLLPEPVGGEHAQAAEARFAVAQARLGRLLSGHVVRDH